MSYKAYVFDAYGTLFDVHSVMKKIHQFFPDQGPSVSEEWRNRQVHYFLVRQLIQEYKPFNDITRWALLDALAINNIDAEFDIVEELMHEYTQLLPFDEVPLLKENHTDKTFTIFSNGTRAMLDPLLANNRLTKDFDLLSANDINIYKPHPKAYQYAHKTLKVNKDEILFFSSNPWDITGAASYGFHTAWVNRKKQMWPEIGIQPTYLINQLNDILI
ncbi:haloacid dehalogenase type II [Halobacillus karajensis]|uniref:(S)-2-haloacid dehalogenase n=1 Tax=Halobacillus karajensis TaxID=195088 RepID=A0A059NYV4_9BACI|nr:haloacid dehalogenase type II [Halobacillus karajensis]CDQ19229.1 (S)-2-haloacid dehalogenase [Halobacillus karajensis]CDQ22697.1 (S)-2-haloacid dehalogenase [Halobacillus karajensis]CDQ26179.1 (S)-2-haloacid dehalogenase [Halobacillus karajensis]